MARDINTLSDIKYIAGPTGCIIAAGQKQVNVGQHHAHIDVEARNGTVGEQYQEHGHVPYEAFHAAMLELAQTYPAPVIE